jgi:hypothetical protein
MVRLPQRLTLQDNDRPEVANHLAGHAAIHAQACDTERTYRTTVPTAVVNVAEVSELQFPRAGDLTAAPKPNRKILSGRFHHRRKNASRQVQMECATVSADRPKYKKMGGKKR